MVLTNLSTWLSLIIPSSLKLALIRMLTTLLSHFLFMRKYFILWLLDWSMGRFWRMLSCEIFFYQLKSVKASCLWEVRE